MEFLKNVLGDRYSEFETLIKTYNENPKNKDKQVKIADLGSGQYVSKKKYDDAIEARDNYKTQFDTTSEKLKKFEGVDVDKIQKELTQLNLDLETERKNNQKREEEYKFSNDLETAIREAGGRNPKAIKGILDIEALKQSKDRTTDIQAALEAAKESDAYLFGTNEPIINPVGPTQNQVNSTSGLSAMRAAMGLPEEK